MIQKVTLKAEDLQQAVPANEITNKYHTLSIKAKDLYERQKETVRLHQEFIDAGNDFAAWLRSAKERISKISEPTGDKEMLSAKSVQFKVLTDIIVMIVIIVFTTKMVYCVIGIAE